MIHFEAFEKQTANRQRSWSRPQLNILMILPVATFILISISFESRFPLKFILGEFWHFYSFEHWAEKENILWLGSWELTHLGFFVLLLLWVVTQNFSSQFHTLDYNTRFYGLTRQSRCNSRLRASFSHLAINKLRQLLRIFPWRAIKVRHFLLNLG